VWTGSLMLKQKVLALPSFYLQNKPMAPFVLPAQHSNDRESNYYNDIYTTDSTELPTSSSLSHNKAYTEYLPNITIALSILYLCVFLLRYIWVKYQRCLDNQRQLEKQRWILAWERVITKCQLKDSLLFDDNQKHRLVFPPSTYDVHSSASSLTLNNRDSSAFTFISEPSTTSIRDDVAVEKSELSCSDNTKSVSYALYNNGCEMKQLMKKGYRSTAENQSKCGFNPIFRNHWKINHKKRLALLWQWSVSMGYCEYSHAKKLNDLVSRLQNNRGTNNHANTESFLLAEETVLQSSNTVDQEKQGSAGTLPYSE
jgi:hypothetical protein